MEPSDKVRVGTAGNGFLCERSVASQLMKDFKWSHRYSVDELNGFIPTFQYVSHNEDGVFLSVGEGRMKLRMWVPHQNGIFSLMLPKGLINTSARPETAKMVHRVPYNPTTARVSDLHLPKTTPFWITTNGIDIVFWVEREEDYLKWKMSQ